MLRSRQRSRARPERAGASGSAPVARRRARGSARERSVASRCETGAFHGVAVMAPAAGGGAPVCSASSPVSTQRFASRLRLIRRRSTQRWGARFSASERCPDYRQADRAEQIDPLHTSPLPQPPSPAPEPQTFLHVYSHVFCALQLHSPGHLIGAFNCGQSQVALQGPARDEGPHATVATARAQTTRSVRMVGHGTRALGRSRGGSREASRSAAKPKPTARASGCASPFSKT